MLSYTGNDLIEFSGRTLADFANGDVVTVTYPNEASGTAVGKDGNVIVVGNEQGRIANVTIRVVRGSADDKFLNSFVKLWYNDRMSFVPASMTLTKMISVDGSVTNDITSLKFGVPSKAAPDAKVNVEGDVEQAVAVYNFTFVSADGRSLA